MSLLYVLDQNLDCHLINFKLKKADTIVHYDQNVYVYIVIYMKLNMKFILFIMSRKYSKLNKVLGQIYKII